MFAYIKGTLIQSSPSSVVMEANGIGYKLFIPASAFSHLPQAGSLFTLHTSFIVRELSQTLYGFFNIQERDFSRYARVKFHDGRLPSIPISSTI